MKNLWSSEPTAVLAVIQAAITLLISFGLHLSAEQIGAILTFSGVLLALINRSQVHSPAAVDAIKQSLTDNVTKEKE
jgi:hypothetical protein